MSEPVVIALIGLFVVVPSLIGAIVTAILAWRLRPHQEAQLDAETEASRAATTASQNQTISDQNATIAAYALQISTLQSTIFNLQDKQRSDSILIADLQDKDRKKDLRIVDLEQQVEIQVHRAVKAETALAEITAADYQTRLAAAELQIKELKAAAALALESRVADAHTRETKAAAELLTAQALVTAQGAPAIDPTQPQQPPSLIDDAKTDAVQTVTVTTPAMISVVEKKESQP